MRLGGEIKRFFFETFRPHGEREYAEFFSRGKGESGAPAYPWFYSRVFLFGLVFYSVAYLCYAIEGNGGDLFPSVLTGGFFADITLLTLVYELYPRRDISYAPLLVALIAGGLVCALISQSIYNVYDPHTYNFGTLVYVAAVEEFSKSAVVVIAFLLLGKKQPFFCLLLGLAVGGGFSSLENCWYIFGGGYNFVSTQRLSMEMAIFRAGGAAFSHAAWCGAFGFWLSQKGKFHWRAVLSYAVNAALHFLINFPLVPMFAGWRGYPVSIVAGILSFASLAYSVYLSRREVTGGFAPRPAFCKPKFISNVIAAASMCMLVLCSFGLSHVIADAKVSPYLYFSSYDDCRAYIQNGYDFYPDFDREFVFYEDLSQNYSYTITEGKLVSATQKQTYGDYTYRFTYSIYYGADETPHALRSSVAVEYGSGVIYSQSFYDARNIQRHFFNMNKNVASLGATDDGGFFITLRDGKPRGAAVYTAVYAASGGLALIGGAAYTIINIAEKRKKSKADLSAGGK